MTTFATSTRVQVGYSAESVWGTTVSGNPFKLIRYTGGDSKTDMDVQMSGEVGVREVTNVFRTRVAGGGSYNFEWSYSLMDDLLQGLFGGTWSTNTLIPGTTFQSFSFEEQYGDITQFDTYKGGVITSVTLNIAPGAAITGSFTYMSKGGINGAVTAGTGTTAAPTNVIMNPVDHVPLIGEGGSYTAIPGIVSASLTFTNEAYPFPGIGTADPLQISFGMFKVSGSISVYYADATYLAKYLAFTDSSLRFTIGGASNLKYQITMAKLNYKTGSGGPSAPNQPITKVFNFDGKYDATTKTAQIIRTP